MAMNGPALAALLQPEIETQVKANFTMVPGTGDAELTKLAKALADAIGPIVVNYIKANGQAHMVGIAGGSATINGTIL